MESIMKLDENISPRSNRSVEIEDLLCCPCSLKIQLVKKNEQYFCSELNCPHNDLKNPFHIVNKIPILISETQTDTICSNKSDKIYISRPLARFNKLKKLIVGESNVTRKNCSTFLKLVGKVSKTPKILVIGGGEKGAGTDELWSSDNFDTVSFDIYASDNTDMVCDAHYIPLKSSTFDGVWIQAVLEHVVDPVKVVEEIRRVLKLNGIVYAETPFMQQVHEGPYDFTRYTVLGHRYLFKKFQLIKLGGNGGSEIVLSWAIRYLVWAITRNRNIARVLGLCFGIILRPLKFVTSKRSMFDASSGVYFLGRNAQDEVELKQKDLIKLYAGQYNES